MCHFFLVKFYIDFAYLFNYVHVVRAFQYDVTGHVPTPGAGGEYNVQV